jgi:hypothetical protein
MSRLLFVCVPVALAAALGCAQTGSKPPAAPVPPAPAEGPRDAAPGAQCLLDEYGIHRKVIVCKAGVRCRGERPTGAPVGDPLKFFGIYFVFETAGAGADEWFLVGEKPTRDSVRGWVPAGAAAQWNTRLSGEPRPGESVEFYAHAAHLEALVASGRAGAAPVARSLPGGGGKQFPWPIVERRLIEHNGQSHEAVRVLFLGAPLAAAPPGAPRYTPSEVEAVRSGLRALDLVFVVDNTLSTKEFVPQIVAAVKQIAETAASGGVKPDIRFALVLYRDYGVPALLFPNGTVTHTFAFTGDLNAFTSALAPLTAATADSQEWEEAVADGLKGGLDLPWRASGLAERALVLVGDSAGHAPSAPKNPNRITDEQLVGDAKKKGVRLFALAIRSGRAEEQARQTKQYEALASGTGGECHPLAGASKIAERVRAVVASRTKEIEKRDEYIRDRAGGKSDADLIASGRFTERDIYEVVQFLGAARVDASRLGPNGIGVGSGWCLSEHNGRATIEKRVFVARWEVELLLANLNDLLPRLSAPRDLLSVLERSVAVREGRFLHRAPNDPPNETMTLFLRKKGIFSKHGLLAFTQAELTGMPEARRAALREQLRNAFIPGLTAATRDDRLFFKLDDAEFAFLPDKLFP